MNKKMPIWPYLNKMEVKIVNIKMLAWIPMSPKLQSWSIASSETVRSNFSWRTHPIHNSNQWEIDSKCTMMYYANPLVVNQLPSCWHVEHPSSVDSFRPFVSHLEAALELAFLGSTWPCWSDLSIKHVEPTWLATSFRTVITVGYKYHDKYHDNPYINTR